MRIGRDSNASAYAYVATPVPFYTDVNVTTIGNALYRMDDLLMK